MAQIFQRRGQSGHSLRRPAMLGRFPARVHFEQNGQAMAQGPGLRLERLQKPKTVNGMNAVSQRQRSLDFVALQVADKVPAHGKRQNRGLEPKLLRLVFAEVTDAQPDQGRSRRWRYLLRDRDKSDVGALSASAGTRRGNPLFDRGQALCAEAVELRLGTRGNLFQEADGAGRRGTGC